MRSTRRRGLAALLVSCGVVLATACASDGDLLGRDTTPQTRPPGSVAPSPSAPPPTDSVAPSTSAAPPEPVGATLALRPDSLGPLRLGMTIPQAQATGLLEPSLDEGCPLHGADERWADLREHDASVGFIDGELAYLHVSNGIATDPGGVRPGDRLDHAVAAWEASGLAVEVDRTLEDVFGVWFVWVSDGGEAAFGASVDPPTGTIGAITAPYQPTCE